MEKRLNIRKLGPSFMSSKEALNLDIGSGDKFFLIQEGLVFGPFLCMGSMEHLEALLHFRQIRIAVEGA